MTNCLYTYKVDGEANKGIGVYETKDNWLRLLDDSENRLFFSIEDIEKELEVTLTLISQRRKTEQIKH